MLLEKSKEIENYIEDCEVFYQPIQKKSLLDSELKSINLIYKKN